jgi:Na+-driven multidrug efflux pump
VLVILAKVFQAPIISIMTSNEGIKTMAFAMLTIALIHEPGRNFNTIIIPALKGAGDVKFPVYVGMIFMWGFGVTLAFVFGKVVGWGLMGICAAMAIDEWSRGLVILWRWRGGRWKTKALVRKQ